MEHANNVTSQVKKGSRASDEPKIRSLAEFDAVGYSTSVTQPKPKEIS